mgnify:CR=1 FL=1
MNLEKSIERIIEKDDMSDSYLRGFYIIYGLLWYNITIGVIKWIVLVVINC